MSRALASAIIGVRRPSFAGVRQILPVVLLILFVVLAYDLRVLDLQATKRAAFQLGVAVWGIYMAVVAFADPARRAAIGIPLVVLAWAMGNGLLAGLPSVMLLEKPVYLAFLALGYVLMRRVLNEPKAWSALLWTLTVLAGVLAASALVEILWLGGEPAFGGAPVVTLGNPNHLGAVLLLLMPAVLSCVASGHARPAVLATGVLTMLGLGLTGSYLALLGVAAIFGIIAAAPTASLTRRLALLALLTGGLVAGLLLARAASPDSNEAPPTVVSSESSDGFERAAAGRWYLFERGVEVVERAPLRGVGVGEFPWAFAAVQAAHLEASPEDADMHTRLEHAHNDPLELLAEFGLVGILALVAAGLVMRWVALQRPMVDLQSTRRPAFAFVGLALFALVSLGSVALFAPQVAVLGVAYLACLPARRVALGRWLTRALLAVLLLLMALGSAVTLRVYMAERTLVQALEALDDGDVEAAEAALEEAQSQHPSGKVLFYRGTLALEQGALDDAIRLLGAAAWLRPNVEVHHNLGVALCRAGDAEGVERLRQAARLDPGYAPTRQALERCESALDDESERQDPETKPGDEPSNDPENDP